LGRLKLISILLAKCWPLEIAKLPPEPKARNRLCEESRRGRILTLN
jgi:hypothetical protein